MARVLFEGKLTALTIWITVRCLLLLPTRSGNCYITTEDLFESCKFISDHQRLNDQCMGGWDQQHFWQNDYPHQS